MHSLNIALARADAITLEVLSQRIEVALDGIETELLYQTETMILPDDVHELIVQASNSLFKAQAILTGETVHAE